MSDQFASSIKMSRIRPAPRHLRTSRAGVSFTQTARQSPATYQDSLILRHLRQLLTSSNVDVLSPPAEPNLFPPQTPISRTIAAVNAGMHN